jgi:hypothetical protein
LPKNSIMPNESIFDIAEGVGALAPDLIDLVENTRGDLQAGLGGGAFNGLQRGLRGIEYDAAPRALDLTEEAMFDEVSLGGIRRIMGDAQTQAETL